MVYQDDSAYSAGKSADKLRPSTVVDEVYYRRIRREEALLLNGVQRGVEVCLKCVTLTGRAYQGRA